MSRAIDDLLPLVALAVRRAIAKLEADGLEVFVDSTFRTLTEQQALFAQGREALIVVNDLRARAGMGPITETQNKYKCTNCDGVKFKSNHQNKTALDVTAAINGRPVWPRHSDPRWKQIADAFIAEGFRWGGDWDGDGKTRYDGDLDEILVDFPHFEVKA